MIPENGVALAERLARLHAGLLFTLLGLCAVCALWALLGAWRAWPPGERQRALLWVAQLLLAAECAVGALLWAGGARPARPEVHLIYAAVALASIPLALRQAHDAPPRQAQATLALGLLFLAAILLRALETARPAL